MDVTIRELELRVLAGEHLGELELRRLAAARKRQGDELLPWRDHRTARDHFRIYSLGRSTIFVDVFAFVDSLRGGYLVEYIDRSRRGRGVGLASLYVNSFTYTHGSDEGLWYPPQSRGATVRIALTEIPVVGPMARSAAEAAAAAARDRRGSAPGS